MAPWHPLPGLALERTTYVGAVHPGLSQAMTGLVQPWEVFVKALGERPKPRILQLEQLYHHSEKVMERRKRRMEGSS